MIRHIRQKTPQLMALVLVFLVMEFWVVAQNAVSAATITVTNTTNQLGADGTCSLPEAIINANENTQLVSGAGECPAGTVGVDTINLTGNVSVSGIVDTTNGFNGLPTITSNIVINGNGNTIFRPAAVTNYIYLRFFNIEPTASLDLNNVKLFNGHADIGTGDERNGGAIYNAGTLSISNATLRANQAERGGAIYNTGTLAIAGSTIWENTTSSYGGGIFNSGTVTISDSIFRDGSAYSGAGIYSTTSTTVTIEGSEFNDNTVSFFGGAIYSDGALQIKESKFNRNATTNNWGGAIYSNASATIVNATFRGNSANYGGVLFNDGNGTFTIANSIFSGNHAEEWGGVLYNGNYAIIYNSTLAGNYGNPGGAIYNHSGASTLSIRNSLIWGNISSGVSPQVHNNSTLFLYATGLEGGTAAISGTGSVNDGGGNLTLADTDTLFGAPIRANGSNTPNSGGNYFLNKYSIAINQGNNALIPSDALDIDNDGNTAEDLPIDRDSSNRVLETTVDMGADESTRCTGITFPRTVNTADALRLAIVCANLTPAWDIINLSGNITLTDSFVGATGLPIISSPIRINGNGYAIRRISTENFRIFYVSSGNLTLNNVRISGGDVIGSGGAIFITGTSQVKLIRTIVSGNQASSYGGAIRVGSSTSSLQVLNSMFIGNKGGNDASAIDTSGEASIINSTFAGNSGEYTIWTSQDMTFSNSVIFGNAITGAAQLYHNTGIVTLTNSAIEDLGDVTYSDNGGNMNLTSGMNIFVAPQPPASAPTAAGNYRLAQFSPLINKGRNVVVNNWNLGVDFEGDNRIVFGTVDIGADEATYLPPENVNLIYNPGFSLGTGGDAGWSATGSLVSNVTAGVMNLRFPATVDGWLRQFRAAYPLPNNAKMVGWVTVSNPDNFARAFQLMFRDSDLSNTYLCNFVIAANAQNQVFSIQFITQTNWEIIEVDMRPNYANTNGLDFDNVNLRYRPYETFTDNLTCISPGSDETPSPPPETELVLTDGTIGTGDSRTTSTDNPPSVIDSQNNPPPEIGGIEGGCSALDWFNTDNWNGYLPTSEVQFVFDPFPTDLSVGTRNGASVYDANGDGVADTLYDALSYNGHGHAASLLREAVIAMLNDRHDSNHPESWWAVEIDTAEALAQGENAMLTLAQQYALSNATCQ